jgi:PAS domain S-box-containing protein
MASDKNEEKLLRPVTLQDAQSIWAARQRAEQELVLAKEALELKTKELAQSLAMMRATLESTTDGILVTDDSGRVTGSNGNFVELWRMPRETMDSREHNRLLEVCETQFAEPEQFRRRIKEIYASSPSESYDLLELLDGRVIERFSRIQRIDQRSVGRVWSFRDITERRRTEQALREQSEWLRTTLSSIGDAVVTTDAKGCVVSLNPVAESLTGWTEQEAQGRPLNTVFHIINEESREPTENPVTRALRESQIVGLSNQAILIAREGSERAIDASAAPIKDNRGNVTGVVLTFRDVTQARHSALAQLRLSAIVESSDDAIISKNLDGIIVSWNKGAETLYGYTAQEVVGKPLSILIPPDHPDELPAIMEQLKRGERIEHFETKRLRKDGSPVDVSVTISPVRSPDGKIIGASKIARDITASKRAEQTTRFLADASAALAELTDYKSTLQQVASLAVPFFADWCAVDILETDGSLRRLTVTHSDPGKVQLLDAFCELYTARLSDRHGVTEVVRTGNPEWAAEISEFLLNDFAQNREHLSPMQKLGLRSYISVPLKSHSRVLGALTFVTAESGRIYDANHVRAAEDLAHRAAVAIENANLLAALRESDRRKDEFLAMLAHELRNPLAPILNAAQILRMKGPPVPELQWARDVIDRQVQQMTRLIDDLLDVSRITRGRIELRKEQVELATVVGSAVEASRPLIEKWGHRLTVKIPEEPIRLDADLTRLSQALSNLLNNAAKYTDKGGHIWLTAERQSNDVVIRVRDNGIGIPREMLPHIFEMFRQLDRSLERSEGGLGIGLTLVQRLVEMHGGTVEAHSSGQGKGSEFVLRLPLAMEQSHWPKPQDVADRQKVALPVKRCILVVDDNQDSADSITLLLRAAGNEVHTAYDGSEAVRLSAECQPDVVLLDIGLPTLSGYDAARLIRQQPGGPDRILIALTGWAQDEDRRKSKEAGFDHHLTKPIDFGVLRQLLSTVKTNQPEGLSATP